MTNVAELEQLSCPPTMLHTAEQHETDPLQMMTKVREMKVGIGNSDHQAI